MKERIIWTSAIVIFIVALIGLNIWLSNLNKTPTTNNTNNSSKQNITNTTTSTIEEINESNFETKVINSKGIVVIDYYADWCGPCKVLSPTVEEIAQDKDYEDITFYKVNVDDNPNIANQYRIYSIPTLIYYKDGYEINRSVGVISKDAIIQYIISTKEKEVV